jgi:amino acid transporter
VAGAQQLTHRPTIAGTILGSTGSIGLALFYWVIGFLMAAAGLAVYLELAAYFPNRSGSETVYLEQAYPRPKHFFPVAFAVQSVILSFSASNAIGELEPPNGTISYEVGSRH